MRLELVTDESNNELSGFAFAYSSSARPAAKEYNGVCDGAVSFEERTGASGSWEMSGDRMPLGELAYDILTIRPYPPAASITVTFNTFGMYPGHYMIVSDDPMVDARYIGNTRIALRGDQYGLPPNLLRPVSKGHFSHCYLDASYNLVAPETWELSKQWFGVSVRDSPSSPNTITTNSPFIRISLVSTFECGGRTRSEYPTPLGVSLNYTSTTKEQLAPLADGDSRLIPGVTDFLVTDPSQKIKYMPNDQIAKWQMNATLYPMANSRGMSIRYPIRPTRMRYLPCARPA